MADEPLPTWDEALATAHLPTWDQALRQQEMLDQYTQKLTGVGTGGAEAYAGVNSGDGPDAFFSHGPAANILSAFGQGAAQEWGAIASGSLSPETEAALKKGGWFNDYDTGRRSIVKSFNEGLFRSAATAYHGFNALMGGTHEALLAAAKEGGPIVGAPFAAAVGAMEAFPVGHGTGFPARIPRALVEANDLKIIGYGEPGWKGLPSPTQVAIDALRPAQEVDRPATRLEFTPEEEPGAVPPLAPETPPAATPLGEALYHGSRADISGGLNLDRVQPSRNGMGRGIYLTPSVENASNYGVVHRVQANLRPDEWLDWERPLSEQPKAKALADTLDSEEPPTNGRDLWSDLRGRHGETGAINTLEAAGIKGNRFSDERVVFDPANLGKPEPLAAPPIDDPLLMQQRGELTAARAAEIAGLPPEEVADPEMWKVIADNLAKAEASREGGIEVVTDQMRYLPDDGVPKTISEREAMAVIGRALDAEAARGGDVESLLAEAGVDTGVGTVGTVGAVGAEAAPRAGATAATEPPRTPNEPFPRAASADLDKAGNIRLDNLGTPEDVNAVIREAAAQGNDFLVARRGVISDAEVVDLADALGMDAKTLDTRRLGEAFNAEQVLAARKLLVQSATDVRDLAARVATGSEVDLVAYAKARDRHMMIQEQVAGITAEAGRALRAFRALEGTAEARNVGLMLMEQTGRSADQLREEARLLSQLDTPQQVSKNLALARQPTWKDMVIEGYIMALLSSTATHVTNLIGNLIPVVNSILEPAGGALIGAGRRAVLGSRAGPRMTAGEVAARTFGLVKGSQEGLIAAARAVRDERAVSATPHTIERPHMRAIPGVTGRVVRVPARLLTAEDELFKAIAFRQELNALAYRQALDEGLTGPAFEARIADLIEHPPDEIVKAAQAASAYQTFANPLGTRMRHIQAFLNAEGAGSIALKLLVPFLRTPANLARYATERSPFGFLVKEARDNLMGRNGSIARDTQIARMAIGTAAATAFVALASSSDMFPTLTGGGPADPAKRAALQQIGWRPYSLKVGNFYVSYAWFDPLATSMGVVADMVEAVKAGTADDADLAKVGSMVVLNLSRNLMSKLSLSQLTKAIQAATDPDRYGQQFLQGFVQPVAALGLAARINDPVERESRSLADAFRARMPGLRQGLHPKIDVWGMPVPNQGTIGPDALSRAYLSKITEDPVNIELQRLGKMPAPVGREIVGVKLTDSQHEDYARTAGVMVKMQLDRLVNSPGFAQWPDFAKREVITKLVDGERERAQELMKQRYPVIWQTALEAKRATVHGATPEHVKSMLRTPVEAMPAGAAVH